MLVRASVAVLVFACLQIGWEFLRGGPLEYTVIHEGTVRPAAALIRALTPDVHAQAVRFSVKAPGGGLNIRNGCEGTEALFLLVAAFLVAPLRWRSRLVGLVAGVALVFIVNQVRVVALFYAWRVDHSLFDLLHGTVTPVAIVLVVGGYFHAFLEFASRRAALTD
jgi:exosortase/archaeosortase family protein